VLHRCTLVDQKLRALVEEIIGQLNDENLETSSPDRTRGTLRPVRATKRRVQLRAKHLEIDRRPKCLTLIAEIVQPP
jgi:hypothetical protein